MRPRLLLYFLIVCFPLRCGQGRFRPLCNLVRQYFDSIPSRFQYSTHIMDLSRRHTLFRHIHLHHSFANSLFLMVQALFLLMVKHKFKRHPNICCNISLMSRLYPPWYPHFVQLYIPPFFLNCPESIPMSGGQDPSVDGPSKNFNKKAQNWTVYCPIISPLPSIPILSVISHYMQVWMDIYAAPIIFHEYCHKLSAVFIISSYILTTCPISWPTLDILQQIKFLARQ